VVGNSPDNYCRYSRTRSSCSSDTCAGMERYYEEDGGSLVSINGFEHWIGSFFGSQFGAGFATATVIFIVIFVWRHKW
jgi:hypothetical protein